MLKKAYISRIKPHSDEWFRNRLAKFTCSDNHQLCYPTGLTSGSISYIRKKVGEELTGEPADKFFETDATRHGLYYEADAIQRLGDKLKLEFVIVQKLITIPGSRFGGTPDGLIIIGHNPDDTEYDVETIEVKSPPTYDNYIGLFLCDTPAKLKVEKREFYWQVLDQMDLCEARKGHFCVFHPKFKAGNFRHIVFDPTEPVITPKGKTFPLYEDLKLLRQRKKMGLDLFEEIRQELMSFPVV